MNQVRTVSHRRMSMLLTAAAIVAAAVAGCGGAPIASVASPSPAPSPTPVTTPGASTPTPTAASSAPTPPPVISCALALEPETSSPTKVVPASLPARLPLDLVPAGAAVYALTLPQSWTWAPDAVYTVGPAGGSCAGWISAGGGSLGMQVFDPRGAAAVDIGTGGGIGSAQMLACSYIAAARKGAEREFGTLDPSACVPSPGDRVTRIATGVQDTDLAVVVSSVEPMFMGSQMRGTTTSLYAFQKSEEDDRGASWRATCAAALPAPTCYAALAFVARGTPDIVFAGGTRGVDAAIAAALGVPATPSTLVARITTYPDVTVGRIPPMVSVYADGRVLSPGWTVTGHDTVPFVVRRLTDAGLATLLAALDAAVPPAGVDYPPPQGYAAGYGTYVVTVRRGAGLVTARATNASTQEAAKELVALAEHWRDPVAALPSDAWVGGPATVAPYEPRRWYLSIWIPSGGSAMPGAPDASIIRPMIGDVAAFGETLGTREDGILRCGVISDETNRLLATALRRAGVDTGTVDGEYRSDLNLGTESVVVSSTPLLPDDGPACPADIGP